MAVILQELLNRLFRFVSTSFMEIRVAGKFTADLIRSVVKARPQVALKTFINHFCDIIKARTSSEYGEYGRRVFENVRRSKL